MVQILKPLCSGSQKMIKKFLISNYVFTLFRPGFGSILPLCDGVNCFMLLQTKKLLTSQLHSSLSSVASMALLHLEQIHSQAAMAFHAFTDNSNAPYKQAVLVLSLEDTKLEVQAYACKAVGCGKVLPVKKYSTAMVALQRLKSHWIKMHKDQPPDEFAYSTVYDKPEDWHYEVGSVCKWTFSEVLCKKNSFSEGCELRYICS